MIRTKYSIYYFITISVYAWTLGLMPLYFQKLGFTPFQISSVSACATLAILLSSPAVLWLTHHFFSPRSLLLLCASAALLFSILLTQLSAYPLILACWFLCMAMKRSADALVDAEALSSRRAPFERVRMWGSFGFILVGTLLGRLYDLFGIKVSAPSVIVLFFLSLLAAALLREEFPLSPEKSEAPQSVQGESQSLFNFKKNFLLLLVTCILCWSSHSVLYSFLSIYLKTLGWSGSTISLAWNTGVVSEITVFFLFNFLASRFSVTTLLRFSILAAVLRWTVLAFATNLTVIFAVQLLHGFTYGAAYASSLRYATAIAPDGFRKRAQGILMGFGHSLGALVGYFMAGAFGSLISSYAETSQLFLLSAVIASAGFLVSLRLESPPARAAKPPLAPMPELSTVEAGVLP